MRAAHRAAGQPVIWKWDVFERPYYTWDTFERPYYTWDVYNRVVATWASQTTNEDGLTGVTINVPYTGGYYKADYQTFNATTKYTITQYDEITSDTTPSEMTDDKVSTDAGVTGLSVVYDTPAFSGYIIKNESLQRFEISHLEYRWQAIPATYGKGTATGATVTDFSSAAYPADGYDAGTELYYVRRAGTTKTPVGTAVSFVNTTYPSNGYDAGTDLWYEIRAGWTKTPTGAIAFSVGDDTYPEEGYDAGTDLWYERR